MSDTNTTAPTPTDRVGKDVGRLERVRHLKRGTEYEVLGEAEAQVATGTVRTTMLGKPLGNIYRRIADGSSLTVYRDPTTGKLWCRPTDEFRDGRFETIASAPAPSDPAGAGGDLGELKRLRRVNRDRKAILERIEELVASGRPIKRDGPEHIVLLANIIEWEDGAPKAGEEVSQAVEAIMGRADRSGQLVASTPGQKGAGEEKTGAPPLGSGSRPSDQAASHPAPAGFDPSRGPAWVSVEDRLPGEQGCDSEEVIVFLSGHCELTDMECRKGAGWGHRFGFFDVERQCFRVHGRPDGSVTHWMPKPLSPLEMAAQGTEAGTAETGTGSVHEGPVSEADAPTQLPSPPSATPEGDPPMTVEEDQIENLIAIWSMRPAPGCEAGQAWEAGARQGWKWAFAALRTLHAAGEVR